MKTKIDHLIIYETIFVLAIRNIFYVFQNNIFEKKIETVSVVNHPIIYGTIFFCQFAIFFTFFKITFLKKN